MGFSFSSFNREFLFDLPDNIQGVYLKIAEAEEKYGDEVIPVIGFGINKNDNPDAITKENPWIATPEEHINVPPHQIVQIRDMMESDEAVSLCKRGKMGAVIVSYSNQYGEQLKFRWVDRK